MTNPQNFIGSHDSTNQPWIIHWKVGAALILNKVNFEELMKMRGSPRALHYHIGRLFIVALGRPNQKREITVGA